ncbi:hypothetical protein [Siminovitchia sp. FSL W7-1587]|uniref:hypothetical protein n=1 Tax=Siminovitchia sp. FSL W7-1587 TaxID=2954699 RepID=UPI0030CED7AD
MTDEEKIEQIISSLENGYEYNPHTIEEQRIILDMNWLINYAKSASKQINELKINNETARENSRRLRKQNKRYREAIEKAMGEGILIKNCDKAIDHMYGILGEVLEGESDE